MDYVGESRIKNSQWIGNLALGLVGTLVGIGMALGAFVIFIGDIRLLPTYIYDDAVVFRSGNGDILFWQSEYSTPLENPFEILSVHRLRLDELGFRLPARVADDYAVVTLGDSYTEGANVARPWSDVFAQETGLATRNLGFRGYGTPHYEYVWQTYGQAENPDIVIVGFFGANDIATGGLDLAPPFPTPLEARAQDAPAIPVTTRADIDVPIIYPITLQNGEPLTFLTDYISWMNTDEHTLVQSVNYDVIRENLTTIYNTAADDTCMVFVYLPSKPEVYFPYVQPQFYDAILQDQKHVLLNSDGTLHIVEDFEITLDKVLNNRPSTGNTMIDLADEIGYETLNLIDAFDAAAAEGEMIFYAYDTHPNQAGQTLAGETIATFVENTCP